MKRTLFVLKHGDYYGGGSSRPLGGLFNSARFVVDALNANGKQAFLEHAVDNNDIDRLVERWRPDVCVIEALWVVPEKFNELKRLHPTVDFVVRLHSELAFLATEGIAMGWIDGYKARGVQVATNSKRVRQAFPFMRYLPNVYPAPDRLPARDSSGWPGYLRVGCFGAIRPLKNHLAQAVAALKAADNLGHPLNFWVQTDHADPQVLKNLRGLFSARPEARLTEASWLPHGVFLGLVREMHVSLQASLSETFNIVSADAVGQGVPIAVSPEVTWASKFSQVDPHSVDAIAAGIERALFWAQNGRPLERINLRRLRRASARALKEWLR